MQKVEGWAVDFGSLKSKRRLLALLRILCYVKRIVLLVFYCSLITSVPETIGIRGSYLSS